MFFVNFSFTNMFPIFDLTSYSEHSEITHSVVTFFVNLSMLLLALFFFFFFCLCMFYYKTHNIISDILLFYSVHFRSSYHTFQKISVSVILYFLIYSFLRFFVSYLSYTSFKIKSDMFLTPNPSCTFFILAQISSAFLCLESELLDLYIHELMLDTFYVYKKKNLLTYLNSHHLVSYFRFFLLIFHLHFSHFFSSSHIYVSLLKS